MTATQDSAAEYTKVGFCNPPKAHQFQKGQSGNPSGRPKGSKNLSGVIAKALSEIVTIDQNGKVRKITKLELAVTQMANKAAAGDRHAAKLIIDLLHQSETRDEARTPGSPISAEERREQDKSLLAALSLKVLNVIPEVTNAQ
jgi:hypothetical protein